MGVRVFLLERSEGCLEAVDWGWFRLGLRGLTFPLVSRVWDKDVDFDMAACLDCCTKWIRFFFKRLISNPY